LSTRGLVDQFFRHEYGRLVAVLAKRYGLARIEIVEDAVQGALMTALEAWKRTETPSNPTAWLFRVANNNVLGELRRRARQDPRSANDDERDENDERHDGDTSAPEPSALLAREIADDLLRMLFVTCDEAIPIESQLVFALKTLCGFDISEIAQRLFLTEANVYKRLSRARAQLRESPLLDADLSEQTHRARLPSVHAVIYLLFTEGYLSSHDESAIRRELCDEALRMGSALAENAVGRTPETFALLALMHLHAARLAARCGPTGGLLLLEEQDRSLWDRNQIAEGISWLARAANGDVFSRYHAEAGIAAEHALAPTFADTRWDRIVECYDLLEAQSPSPIHALNRALAVAELRGPESGLRDLERLAPPTWLEGSHLWSAALADLHARCGQVEAASQHRLIALELAPSEAVRELLRRRLLR
jgi:RNA polymerase sigma-70 factor (ECF subfamily)